MMTNRIFVRLLITLLSSIFIQIDAGDTDALILTPFINNGSIDEARILAEVDPTLFRGIQSYAAFITVKPEWGSNLFFWYFPHEDPTAPLVIFLNGGPGVSSLISIFGCIGHFELEENLTVKLREVTWAEEYSLLFIDQPVGAGFSYTENKKGYATTEEDVGSQLYIFLQQFLELFPEVRKSPLFIAGESYAGKYVPAFAFYVYLNNGIGKPINLKGIILGNPLIDLRYMFPNYNKLMRELAFMDSKQLDNLRDIEEEGLRFIEEGLMTDASNKFNETIEYIKKKTGVNVYNFMENPQPLAPTTEDFLQRPEIRKLIHVGNTTFDLNNQLVYQYMLADISKSVKPYLEKLLEEFGVLIYSGKNLIGSLMHAGVHLPRVLTMLFNLINGQLDLIIPHSLTKRVIDKLQWSGRSEFDSASRRKIFRGLSGEVVAYKQSGGGLTEALIRNCGHMVPKQQPDVLKFLVDVFVEQFR